MAVTRPKPERVLSITEQVGLLRSQVVNYRLSATAAKQRLKDIADLIREVESTLPTMDAPLQERLEAKGARKLAAKIRKRLGKWGYQ